LDVRSTSSGVTPDRRGFARRVVGAVHVSVWGNGADEGDVSDLEAELRQTVTNAGGVSVLMVVEAKSPLASLKAQSRAATMVRELGGDLRAVCIVIEGEGVQAAAVRSVFVALATLLRPRFRWKTFADTEPAFAWLAQLVQSPVTPELLRATLRRIRAG
jgi:hypothetical protein